MEIQKVLVIQTAFIGDVILATPIIEAIHQHSFSVQIDILVRKGNESLFENHPFINEVIVWNKKDGKYRNLFNILQKIRSKKYSVVINCQRFAAAGFLTAFSNARVKIGFDKNPFSSFFTYKLPHQIKNGLHECARNLSLLAPISINGSIQPKLYPPTLNFRPPLPYICLAPASVWFTKQWPAEKWVELIATIPEKCTIYLTGAPLDKALCDEIIKKSNRKNTINLSGKLSLLQSAALFKGAEMNYVNDSAPMHLCSAINAPVTAIYCSTIPEFGFGPLSDNSHILQTKEKLSCRPCGLHGFKSCPEKHFRCALNIEIEAII
jgi:heptosyltransferase-2